MSKIDFDSEFEKFVAGGNGSAIQEIYSIIPAMSQEQMQIVNSLMFFSERYDLEDLKRFISTYLLTLKDNKNLSFLSSMNMKNLLKAYTMDELVKGVKANVSRTPDQ